MTTLEGPIRKNDKLPISELTLFFIIMQQGI